MAYPAYPSGPRRPASLAGLALASVCASFCVGLGAWDAYGGPTRATAPGRSTPAPSASAQSAPSPAAGGISPAAERVIASDAGPGRARAAGKGKDGSAGEPAIRGPKLPEALRKQLQARLDLRVDS